MDIYIENYSDKSFAVFGDTKLHKDNLKLLGGRYNPNLKINGEKKIGWIFSNKNKTLVEKYITNLNPKKDN